MVIRTSCSLTPSACALVGIWSVLDFVVVSFVFAWFVFWCFCLRRFSFPWLFFVFALFLCLSVVHLSVLLFAVTGFLLCREARIRVTFPCCQPQTCVSIYTNTYDMSTNRFTMYIYLYIHIHMHTCIPYVFICKQLSILYYICATIWYISQYFHPLCKIDNMINTQ